ncbi:MAG: alpha/beta hydrolase [Acidimicrobiales bacterium]|jgi:arylformamidase|nr:alpha/beta hydrolase [Acidimicrobiales bacterium]|tara:strand:- start:2241 stop:3137 length:897 start_codon:yes stop_codon:yes gene_type:complete
MDAEELAGRWREMSPGEREEAYSPSSCIGGDYAPFLAAYRDRSAAARAGVAGWLEHSYGPSPSQCLDLFMPVDADGPVPLLVFVHGGYWQELSKDDSSFAAPAWVDRGVAFAALDYTLAPEASLAEIVAECRRAVSWLHENAADLGVDERRILVAGSSAGAHLAAMVAIPGWQRTVGCSGSLVAGTVLISGIFDLEPLGGTSIAEPLRLTDRDLADLSPARLQLGNFPPSTVCWGEVETDEFKSQSRDFAARLDEAGTPCTSFEVSGRNHFDVVFELADPGSLTGMEVASMLEQPREA